MKKKLILSLTVVLCVIGIALVTTGASVYLDRYGPIGAKIFGQVTMKNTHLDANFISATNKDANARFSVDSAGTLTAVAYAVTPGQIIRADSCLFKVGMFGYKYTAGSPRALYVTNWAGTSALNIDSLGTIRGGVGYLSDTSNFGTNVTWKGIYIPGALTTDRYVATPRYQFTAVALPVAGDLLSCMPKKDSLVVLRAAGTTSGLGFTWVRLPY